MTECESPACQPSFEYLVLEPYAATAAEKEGNKKVDSRRALRGTIALETSPICKPRLPKALASTRSDLFGDEAHEE
jgi:hypothetical protein